MHKDKLEEFLNGELNLEDFKEKTENHSVEREFVDSFEKLVETTKEEIPDFNPFAKIETEKKKRFLIVRRILPYAASILLIVSLFIFFQNRRTLQSENQFTAEEMVEIQKNTELALMHFSKELNACIAEIDKAQKTRQPFTELYSINHFKIEFDNPTKNLKIN